jgi:hypothetical protein
MGGVSIISGTLFQSVSGTISDLKIIMLVTIIFIFIYNILLFFFIVNGIFLNSATI